MTQIVKYYNDGLIENCITKLIGLKEFLAFQSEKDYDPFADRRRATIADREDEYRQKRRRLIISPERVDPFADGECFYLNYFNIFILNELYINIKNREMSLFL